VIDILSIQFQASGPMLNLLTVGPKFTWPTCHADDDAHRPPLHGSAGAGTDGRTDGRTDRYDTRCYFNVRSKADMSRLNLPHGTNN